jgi:hypothetical protein
MAAKTVRLQVSANVIVATKRGNVIDQQGELLRYRQGDRKIGATCTASNNYFLFELH